MSPLALVPFLHSVKGNIAEKDIVIGAKDQVKSRLIVSRVPEMRVNERRRKARKNAKKKGYTPSHAHLTLLAWNLFITNVPQTIWKTETVVKVYPLRWQIELIFQSWKSYLHLASIKTKKEDTTLCYLYGRMLLILLNYALSPQLRTTLWVRKRRELSVLKLVRHFQAFADGIGCRPSCGLRSNCTTFSPTPVPPPNGWWARRREKDEQRRRYCARV